jgi:leucyl-tRNA synthetase
VDLYIGGSEHATGHLLYSRFWQKFMFDMGYVPKDEFAKKLINQGMITGTSAFVEGASTHISFMFDDNTSVIDQLNVQKYIDSKKETNLWVSGSLLNDDEALYNATSSFVENEYERLMNIVKEENLPVQDIRVDVQPDYDFRVHADVSLVNTSDELDVEGLKHWRHEFEDAHLFTSENQNFKVIREVEKMSKSKYNVVNPDAICEEYGADSLRLYEMFLGPLEQSKPWNTAGITGVHSFLKKLWKLYSPFIDSDAERSRSVTEAEPTADNLKTLHKTIKKVEEDIENFSFNTSVSTFMICVNELTAQKCTSKAILEPLAILVSPYAPHIAEELWSRLGHTESIAEAPFPKFEEKYLVESSKEYPISFNGKMRFKLELPLDMGKDDIEAAVLAHEKTQEQLQGRTPKKVIVVPGKIVNIVG